MKPIVFVNLIFYEHVRLLGCGPPVGPFPSRPNMGSIGEEWTPLPPPNPRRHLKKERSELPLKWLLKEDRGRRPTASAAALAPPPPSLCHRRHCQRRSPLPSCALVPPPNPFTISLPASHRPTPRSSLSALTPHSSCAVTPLYFRITMAPHLPDLCNLPFPVTRATPPCPCHLRPSSHHAPSSRTGHPSPDAHCLLPLNFAAQPFPNPLHSLFPDFRLSPDRRRLIDIPPLPSLFPLPSLSTGPVDPSFP